MGRGRDIGPVTMALTVCVRQLTGLPGTHDRQVRLSFRGKACRSALRIFGMGRVSVPPFPKSSTSSLGISTACSLSPPAQYPQLSNSFPPHLPFFKDESRGTELWAKDWGK